MIFLAEAFTKAAMMRALAKLGFNQSYTYFTWKTSRWDLVEYVVELATSGMQEYYRPNFFANTPDILHEYLVHGGPPAFHSRLVLAATLSPSYGIYSGFEHFENVPVREGSEEYLDSEKYEVKQRALDGPLLPAIGRLNRARREHPALQHLANIWFMDAANDALIAYAKRSGDDVVLCVVNLDPHWAQEGAVTVPAHLGLPPAFGVRDLPRQRGVRLADRPQLRAPRGRRRARHGGPLTDLDPRTAEHTQPSHWFERDPLWFKRAVFYEIHIRGFFDGNGDGMGDFRGLIEKLDYLQWLGVDCIWLLPMYPSPLRDGGYDVADFTGIHPDFGTVEDFRLFVDDAHQRGMRVIADFVMNHTSSEHPWFQEARASPDSPKRDWYVWSDTVHRYEDARIIFIDTEQSNWTWDEQAGAYFWHRFFSHQPDLNFDNPEVCDAMIEVLRFWLDLGIDGFRLDAIPYLYERDGTICENLDETHGFLKRVRREVDEHYPDRVLLAEANQWPEDVVQYFGDGDECHMCFHFPVMPRMFMSLRREDATPMLEILERTPAIPDNCQWGLFLRNHDELTLEMVTDEERDYMYAEYAKDPRMKINLGHPPAARAAARQRPRRDRAAARDPVQPAGLPGPLLRRRDRHGRQRLPRRPRRRPHADAVDGRPQRRVLARRLRRAVRAAADGPGLRLPGGQRRGPAAHADVAAALGAAVHRAAQGASGLRAGQLRAAAPVEPEDLRPRPPPRGRRRPVRAQRGALGPGGRARPAASSTAATRSRCSGARGSPASASCPTCSRWRPARLLLVPAGDRRSQEEESE